MILVFGLIESIAGLIITVKEVLTGINYGSFTIADLQCLLIGVVLLSAGLVLIGLWKIEQCLKTTKKEDELKPSKNGPVLVSNNLVDGIYQQVRENGIVFLMNPSEKKYRCRFCKAVVDPTMVGCPKCGKDF